LSVKESILPSSTVEDTCTVYVQGAGSSVEDTCTVYVQGAGSTVEDTCTVYVQEEIIKRERTDDQVPFSTFYFLPLPLISSFLLSSFTFNLLPFSTVYFFLHP